MKAVIDKLSGGIVPDQVNYNLPDGLFSDGRNVRFRDDSAEKTKGNEAVFGSLSSTAIWALPIGDGVTSYWAYGNEAILYATDGTTHSQISTASYNCPINIGYTGGQFHGYLILNDTNAVPQRWSPGLSNKVRDLDNWPASTFCRVIRPFGDFLIALRVTQSSVYNPRLLRWSDAAAFGALPTSWDYTDPTNQAGITELGETEDEIVDCLPMRGNNIIYKGFSTYLMQPVGGLDVFSFRQLFNEAGLLTEDCVQAFGATHFVLTDADIIVHDGSIATSVADKKIRRWLFNNISPTRFQRSFVVPNHREREMWICFPETGNDFPNLALVWSWADNTFHVRELGFGVASGHEGIVIGSELTFDGIVGTFDDQEGTFDEATFTPFSKRLVLWRGTAKQALQADTGETFNGTTMTAYVERANIGLTRDVGSIKRIRRVFPKIIGTSGDTFRVYVGARTVIDGAVTYSGPFSFTIGSDYKIDCRVSARWLSLKFETVVTNTWRLAGFDVEFDPDGMR
jgi:hypothetical protein